MNVSFMQWISTKSVPKSTTLQSNNFEKSILKEKQEPKIHVLSKKKMLKKTVSFINKKNSWDFH